MKISVIMSVATPFDHRIWSNPSAVVNLLVQCEHMPANRGMPIIKQIVNSELARNPLIQSKIVRCLFSYGDGEDQRQVTDILLNSNFSSDDARTVGEWSLLVSSKKSGYLPALMLLCRYTAPIVVNKIIERYGLTNLSSKFGELIHERNRFLSALADFSKTYQWNNEYSAAVFGSMIDKFPSVVIELIRQSANLPRSIIEIIKAANDESATTPKAHHGKEVYDELKKRPGWWSEPGEYFEWTVENQREENLVSYLFSPWLDENSRLQMFDLVTFNLPVDKLEPIIEAVASGGYRNLYNACLELLKSRRITSIDRTLTQALTANSLANVNATSLLSIIKNNHLEDFADQGFMAIHYSEDEAVEEEPRDPFSFSSWYHESLYKEAGFKSDLVSILAAFLATMPFDVAVVKAIKMTGKPPAEVQAVARQIQQSKFQPPAQVAPAPVQQAPVQPAPAAPAPKPTQPTQALPTPKPAAEEPAEDNAQNTNLDDFFTVLRSLESGTMPNGGYGAIGDHGLALGPLQIHKVYWKDAKVPGEYQQCAGWDYSRRVAEAYMKRYCPKAMAAGDWEKMAKTHHSIGGLGNEKYWENFKKVAKRLGFVPSGNKFVKAENLNWFKQAARQKSLFPPDFEQARSIFEERLQEHGIDDKITYKVKSSADRRKDQSNWLALYRSQTQHRSRPTFWVNERFPEIVDRTNQELDQDFGAGTHLSHSEVMTDTLFHEYGHVVYEAAADYERWHQQPKLAKEFSNLVLKRYPYQSGDELNKDAPMEQFADEFMNYFRGGCDDPAYFAKVIDLYKRMVFEDQVVQSKV